MLRHIQPNGFRQYTSYDVINCSGTYSLMASVSSHFRGPWRATRTSSPPGLGVLFSGRRSPESRATTSPALAWWRGVRRTTFYPQIRDARCPSGTTNPARHMDRPSLLDSGVQNDGKRENGKCPLETFIKPETTLVSFQGNAHLTLANHSQKKIIGVPRSSFSGV